MRENQPKQLLDRIADTPRSSLTLGLGVFPSLARQPIFDERVNVAREFLPATCPGPLSKLSKSEQDRHPYKDIPRGIVLHAEPDNVMLDRVADPGCPDSIDCGRADEIAVQHDNLLSGGRLRR